MSARLPDRSIGQRINPLVDGAGAVVSYPRLVRLARAIVEFLVVFVVAIADIPENVDSFQPWTFIVGVIASVLVALRSRTRPWGAVAVLGSLAVVALAAQLADDAGQMPVGLLLVAGLLLADVGYHQSWRRVGAVGAGAAVTAVLIEGLADGRAVGDIVFTLMMWALAVAVAVATRFWRQERTTRAERVRAEERERIARDLHDVVAHHVSGIAVTAEGAKLVVDRDPSAVAAALDSIHGAASTTLDEMRRMVSILRDGAGADAPLTLAALADELTTTTSPRVTVVVDDAAGGIETQVATAARRIVQESVTNSRRHGRDVTRIDASVTIDGDELVVLVADDGRPSGRRPAGGGGGGFGIVGMHERVTLLGGQLRVGPTDTGWRVEARMPCHPSGTRSL